MSGLEIDECLRFSESLLCKDCVESHSRRNASYLPCTVMNLGP